jgi:hypothetical protein
VPVNQPIALLIREKDEAWPHPSRRDPRPRSSGWGVGVSPGGGRASARREGEDFGLFPLTPHFSQKGKWAREACLRLAAGAEVGVAVALPEGGLFTPVILNAELKSISEIFNEMKDLAARARSKRLAPMNIRAAPQPSPILAYTALAASTP